MKFRLSLFQGLKVYVLGFPQLKEIHITDIPSGRQVLHRKRQFKQHSNLKVFMYGFRIDDVAEGFYKTSPFFHENLLRRYAQDPLRLAHAIPVFSFQSYSDIERWIPFEWHQEIFQRFTDLDTVYVNEPVQDAQRFLDFVKNMNISKFEFHCDQPPNLFDRLPEYCNVESLVMRDVFSFSIEHLKKFNNLICIDIRGTLA